MFWRYFFLVLAGMAGGIIGGMGMGGGTLLIPIITIFLNVPQHIAQWINLIAFVPMAIIAIIIHLKHHLIKYKKILPIIIPAIITAILASFLAVKAEAQLLKKLFGVFLIIMAMYSLIMTYIEHKRNNKEKHKEKSK